MKLIILSTVAALASLSAASAAGAEEWNAFSRSSQTIFLADVATLGAVDGVTTIRVARVPLNAPQGDYNHSVETVELKCAAKQSRVPLTIEYGPDGAETDRYDDAAAVFEDIPANGLASFLQTIACEGARADGANAASIKAFIDGGRGK